jgi:hypothetical protein
MEYKIPSEDKDLKKLNLFLRDLQKAYKPLELYASIPRDAGKDIYTVTSYVTAAEIMTAALKK